MPLDEKKAFIEDEKPNMTFEEKNQQLSAELAVAPNSNTKSCASIASKPGSGWWITYRVGSPD